MKIENALITGGAGFIGSNLTARLLRNGHKVSVFDNLSRSGTASNMEWLRSLDEAKNLTFIQADLRDTEALKKAAIDKDAIFHLAGQVAVTTSVTNPRADFEDNALGTFNALEAARLSGLNPIFIYSSTNKVYGGMDDIQVCEKETRYEYKDLIYGVPETQPLDFHSPYGCSKGAGDQYVRDYARIYGLRTVVMRQSCIYGYRQFGIEDQGWVAWFIIAALKRRPIKIYGDGKQIRDILFIDDLLNAYESAVNNIDVAAGQVYNIGGGPQNTMSIWSEFGVILEELMGEKIPVTLADCRPGDQRVYVSDLRKANTSLQWVPEVSIKQGISQLFHWIKENQSLFSHL